MATWKDIQLHVNATLHDAIVCLDSGALQIVIVVDDAGILQGTVTDGDIRRAILAGKQMTDPIRDIMNAKPVFVSTDARRDEILALMKSTTVRHVPVVDADGSIVGLELLEQFVEIESRDNCVVLMVGGLGTRLMPHTANTPKPMLKVGGTPMLERIINGFVTHGFRKIIMAVNYKAEMISDYFGDGAKFGADISYVHEDKRMGTAGALSLIKESFDQPFFVMNGDVLTDCNFEMMLDFHNVEKSTLTMAVREYDMQVPFGVVNLQQRQISTIDEKPVHSFFVNAGIYVLEPKVFDYIQSDTYTDMPTVVQAMVDDGHKASAFPLRETWLDVGRDEDYRLAEEQFKEGRS
jgi:dTDP-glucose pyrophosphorylase